MHRFSRENPDDEQLKTLLEAAEIAAARYYRRGREPAFADLFQDGCIGALTAHRRFRPGRGASYRTWLNIGALGAVRHAMRNAWTIRRPRWFFEAAAQAPKHEVPVVLTQSLDEILAKAFEGEWRMDAVLGAEEYGYEQVEGALAFSQFVRSLEVRRQFLLIGYFADGATQEQLAAELGVSQKHVSRLLARTIEEIRKAWGREAYIGRNSGESLSNNRIPSRSLNNLGPNFARTLRTDQGVPRGTVSVIPAPGLPPGFTSGSRSGVSTRPQYFKEMMV